MKVRHLRRDFIPIKKINIQYQPAREILKTENAIAL